MNKTFHMDCESYVPVDVFKGLCSREKTTVPGDEECCADFVQVRKCRLCGNYQSKEEHLGSCMGKYMAYPDMLAKTCEDFAPGR